MTGVVERHRIHHPIKAGLRWIEAKIRPKAAQERDFYVAQERLLADPEKREKYLQYLREKSSSLVPESALPIEDIFHKFEPTQEMFRTDKFPWRLIRREMVLKSDHNIAHAGIVMTGALFGARHLASTDSSHYGHLDEDAILTSAALHDTQRLTDGIESVIGLQTHGRIAAKRLPELLSLMGVSLSEGSLKLTKQILEYHDVDRKQLGDAYTPELGIVVAADRASLQRLFSSAHWSTQIIAGVIAEDRMREFKNGGIASNPEIFGEFTELLGALDILVKEKLQAGHDPKKQFQLVLDSAKELGLISSVSSSEKVAA